MVRFDSAAIAGKQTSLASAGGQNRQFALKNTSQYVLETRIITSF